MKNKSYIAVSFIVLIFGILVVPKIVERVKNGDIAKADRLNSVEKDSSTENSSLKTMGKAPFFKLTDQDGKEVTNENYKGKVYVLEFFFSTCPSICPKMNANLKKVAAVFAGNKNFAVASITIDPAHDTPEVLKAHKSALGIESENWHFLTGDKAYIYNLANKGFNLYAGQNDKFSGGFEHSGLFALIDQKGDIRCRKDEFGNPIMYYDGLNKEGVANLERDINILLQE